MELIPSGGNTMKAYIFIIVGLLLLSSMSALSFSPLGETTKGIKVTFMDKETYQRIQGVKVIVFDPGREVYKIYLSDSLGNIYLPPFFPYTYKVTYSKEGYFTEEEMLYLKSPKDIVLWLEKEYS